MSTHISMANLKMGDKTEEVSDGGEIRPAAEKLGVPFSCGDGVCGSCLVQVVAGEDNLSDLTAAEKEFGLKDKKKRLCCQVKIKSGDVEIRTEY
jgi:ferredoxin